MKRLEYREVVRVLGTDENRTFALSLYREAGFTGDCFATKTAARVSLAEALIALEDRLEPGRRQTDREAIRGVRRRLEVELWP